MALDQQRKLPAELARLDAAAQGAGLALVCTHETADDLHRSLVRRYLSLHPLRHPIAYATQVGLRRDPS